MITFSGTDQLPKAATELYDLARPLLHPLLLPWGIEASGVENIPREGAAILASNHRSYLDGPVIAALASWRGRKLRFLGKREIFEAPVLKYIARAAGQIPVDRGTGSTRPLRAAIDALDRGEAVAILPQGTIPRGERFFDPVLRGKPGVVRMALASGAPVIPIAVWGTEKIWPRSARMPDLGTLKAKVYARVGEPIYLKAPPGEEENKPTLDRLAQEVMDGISELLPDDVRTPEPPSPAELAAASPPATPAVQELLWLPARFAGSVVGRLFRR
jgi:putative phosphoserine phosphatase/1-acylglycerol-3-phosphate O-acyltransferase